jgi:hypothetical protein
MAVQTRSRGFLQYFDTVAEAYEAWKADPSIEKISWDDSNETYQLWRPLTKGTSSLADEAHLYSISQNYKDAPFGTKWWYPQPLGASIQEITSDTNFRNRFCTMATP